MEWSLRDRYILGAAAVASFGSTETDCPAKERSSLDSRQPFKKGWTLNF